MGELMKGGLCLPYNIGTSNKQLLQAATVPPSILVRIVLVHLRKTSSTFSPVSALVSRNDNSSVGEEGGESW